jgi:hypothetical protein
MLVKLPAIESSSRNLRAAASVNMIVADSAF